MYFISSDIEWLGKIIPTELLVLSPLCLHVHFVPWYDLPSTCNEEFKPKRTLLPSTCTFIPVNSGNALLSFYESWHFYIIRIYNIQSQMLPASHNPPYWLASPSVIFFLKASFSHNLDSTPTCSETFSQ